MCGRYYVDDDTAREIEKVVRQADERMRQAAENSVTIPSPNQDMLSLCCA